MDGFRLEINRTALKMDEFVGVALLGEMEALEPIVSGFLKLFFGRDSNYLIFTEGLAGRTNGGKGGGGHAYQDSNSKY